MFGHLSEIEIEALLGQEIVGHLGCHAEGETYVVPISYAYDGNYFYGHTYEGRKIDMMRKNPQVCLQVDNHQFLDNWKSVICWGEFEELKDEKDRAIALKQLMARALPLISSETMHISPHWPFPADDDLTHIGGLLYRIRVTEKTGRFEKRKEDYFFAT